MTLITLNERKELLELSYSHEEEFVQKQIMKAT